MRQARSLCHAMLIRDMYVEDSEVHEQGRLWYRQSKAEGT
jgi:hypothetical protein